MLLSRTKGKEMCFSIVRGKHGEMERSRPVCLQSERSVFPPSEQEKKRQLLLLSLALYLSGEMDVARAKRDSLLDAGKLDPELGHALEGIFEQESKLSKQVRNRH